MFIVQDRKEDTLTSSPAYIGSSHTCLINSKIKYNVLDRQTQYLYGLLLWMCDSTYSVI